MRALFPTSETLKWKPVQVLQNKVFIPQKAQFLKLKSILLQAI